MIKITDFNGSVDTNRYKFRNYDIREFSLYVKGKRVPSVGLTLEMDYERASVMGYKTLYEGSGIHHSKSGQHITHDMYINGYFMLLFDVTPDRGGSEGHTSLTEKGNIRIVLLYSKTLHESIMCLLYLEYECKVLVNLASSHDQFIKPKWTTGRICVRCVT